MTDTGGGNSSNGNGGPRDASPDLTDPEVAWQMVAQEIFVKLSGLVALFGLKYLAGDIPKVVDFMVREQQMYQQQLVPAIMDASRLPNYPKMKIVMQRRNERGQATGKQFDFPCPKVPHLDNGDETLRWCMLMLFVLHPEFRALLRIFGYDYQVHEAKEPSVIIFPDRH